MPLLALCLSLVKIIFQPRHPTMTKQNTTTIHSQIEKMAENTEADVIAGGVAFDDYFESIGKKAAGLSLEEQNGQPKADVADTEDADEQKIVDEIESLCMNCHANVSLTPDLEIYATLTFCPGNHTTPLNTNPILPRDHHHVLLLPTLQFQELRDTVCWRNPAKGCTIRTQTHHHARLLAATGQVRHLRCQVYRARSRSASRTRATYECGGTLEHGFGGSCRWPRAAENPVARSLHQG